MRSSPGRTPVLRRMRGGGAAPRAMTAEPFQVRVPSVGWVMRPPAATSCGSSSNEGLSSSTKRSRDTHDVRGPVSPSGMRFMRPPRSGPTVRNTSSLSFRPTLPTSSTSRAEGESGFTPSIVTGAHNAGYQKRGNGLKSVLVRGGFVGFRRKRARRADAAYKRQLERGIERIDSEAQAQDVHFEAFHRARGETGEPEQRKLEAASARGGPDEFPPGIVFADRGRGQIGFELGHRAQYPGGESVGVRTGPHGVFAGPRVGARGLVDARDEFFDACAALFGDELGRRSEPAHVGRAMPHHERRVLRAQAPADDLVHRVLRSSGRFHRDPGVDPENAPPSDDTGRVHLDDRIPGAPRVGREAYRLLAGGAPVLRGDPAYHSGGERDRACEEDKADDTHVTPH